MNDFPEKQTLFLYKTIKTKKKVKLVTKTKLDGLKMNKPRRLMLASGGCSTHSYDGLAITIFESEFESSKKLGK